MTQIVSKKPEVKLQNNSRLLLEYGEFRTIVLPCLIKYLLGLSRKNSMNTVLVFERIHCNLQSSSPPLGIFG